MRSINICESTLYGTERMKAVVLYLSTNVLMVFDSILSGHNEFKMHQGSPRKKHKMITVMGSSSENLITLCKCKVILFYVLMQISETVTGTHSK